jgi:regulatory protein
VTKRRTSSERHPSEPPDRERAVEIAAHFLATRPRTRWEIRRRLRRSGATDEVIEATLTRLGDLGLADDVAFARWWAEQRDRHAPRGRRMVEAELRQRGVPREVIEELRGAEIAEPVLDAEGLPATELERARAALEHHLRGRPVPADRLALQRLGMFLVRRGFDPQTARDAIRQAGADDEEDA